LYKNIDLDAVPIDATWQGESVTCRGDSTTIWNNKPKQESKPDFILKTVERMQQHSKFATMPDQFGGLNRGPPRRAGSPGCRRRPDVRGSSVFMAAR